MANQQRGFTRECAYLVAGSSSGGRAAKWTDWMDSALVRQVLATDPINCGRGRTVAKWAEVAKILGRLKPQPILRRKESCRQRVKKLVEIYKVTILPSY